MALTHRLININEGNVMKKSEQKKAPTTEESLTALGLTAGDLDNDVFAPDPGQLLLAAQAVPAPTATPTPEGLDSDSSSSDWSSSSEDYSDSDEIIKELEDLRVTTSIQAKQIQELQATVSAQAKQIQEFQANSEHYLNIVRLFCQTADANQKRIRQLETANHLNSVHLRALFMKPEEQSPSANAPLARSSDAPASTP